MKAVDILIQARARVEDIAHWVQFYSQDGDAFCVLGAICSGAIFTAADSPTDYFREAIGEGSITAWNDRPSRTHAEVLAAFDRAIALAGKPETA